jgi:uncharacterized protein YdhG (YjbR/CyaY superfamily)
MNIPASTPDEYISKLPEERKEAFTRLREVINQHIPQGFEERMSYGMIGWVVPHSLYPDGYHCDTKLPLPFMSIASQKNFVAVYHMGVYANPALYEWFTTEYGKRVKTKLDMGKSCVRLKKMDQIPFDLFGELAAKMTVQEWVDLYEQNLKR